MPIIEIEAEQCGKGDYVDLVPGSRVAYRGTLWKVVGVYFASGRQSAKDGAAAVSGAGKRTKYLVLQSLEMALESLHSLGGARSS